MAEPDAEPPRRRPTFPWRTLFHRSSGVWFVVSSSRRLRYANPAWEALTGRPLTKLRGMRISSRRSVSDLGQALAVPPEVWAGVPAQVRRAVPPAMSGPPWWDITYLPVRGPNQVLAVIASLTLVGSRVRKAEQVAVDWASLTQDLARSYSFDLLTGPTLATERLVNQARLASQTLTPIWLIGEPGTGKSTTARVIHHQSGARESTFLKFECSAVPPALIEGLLVGKGGLMGSTTVGTLYLEEPSDLPRDLQDRLAQWVLSPSSRAPRLICGSTRSASAWVAEGRLMPQFQTALSVLELELPALRERLDDLPRLVDQMLNRASLSRLIEDEVWPLLRLYPWPGNLRELDHVVQDVAIRATEEVIEPRHLPRFITEYKLKARSHDPRPEQTLDAILEQVERRLLEVALRHTGQNIQQAADRLGIYRTRLWRRMEALGLSSATGPSKARPRKPTDPAEGTP